jgi:hypothetical protein
MEAGMHDTQKMQELAAAFLAEQDRFTPGQLVVWKDGLSNRMVPNPGTPVVVIEHKDVPERGEHPSGSPYFAEPLDLVLGLIDRDGDFMTCHFDSRRFKLYDGNGK